MEKIIDINFVRMIHDQELRKVLVDMYYGGIPADGKTRSIDKIFKLNGKSRHLDVSDKKA